MTSGSPAPSSSQNTPISEKAAWLAVGVERYVLPWLYFGFAYRQLATVQKGYARYQALALRGLHPSWAIFCADVTKYVLMTCLSLFIAITLFLSRRPTHLPKNVAHILTPLAMSYYFFLYAAVDPTLHLLPPVLCTSLFPVEYRIPAAIVAVLFSIAGYAVALWGLFYLRRSFAVLVAVRKVVSRGPYAYVRHPMYLGYTIELVGLLLASFSLGMIILALGFLMLMMARARLEEERLVEACPAYRDYMEHTGFIFPRWGVKAAPIS